MIAAMALALCSWTSTQGAPVTRLTIVDSSPTSWVARGLQDYTVTPEDGWNFTPSRNFDNGIGFSITGPALPGTTITDWGLDFAAPFDAELTPGIYNDFQRWPFQDSDRPGLSFSSTGRLDNMASGSFEILSVTYDTSGDVTSFAADFTHFGETNPINIATVEIRFNFEVIPEPSTLGLMATGLVALVGMLHISKTTRDR